VTIAFIPSFNVTKTVLVVPHPEVGENLSLFGAINVVKLDIVV